jgi:hypothetical protein
MSLQERLLADLKEAMRGGEERRRSVIRLLRSAIHYAEVEKGKPLDDQEVVGVIAKQVKQRRESIEEFRKGQRPDLVEREEAELALLLEYLPPQASREEVEEVARRAIAETGAQGRRDMGKVMPIVMGQMKGRAEGRLVSEVVQTLLSEGSEG